MTQATPHVQVNQLEVDDEQIRRHRNGFLVLGVIWMILGVVAIVLPHIAALAVNLTLGAILTVGGIVQVVHAFSSRRWQGFAQHMLHAAGGGLAAVLGVLLLLYPLHGVLTLTLALACFFLASGTLKVIAAIHRRGASRWLWGLASGALTLLVGVLIWFGWPSTAAWALGLLVGIEFIVTGTALALLAAAGSVHAQQGRLWDGRS